MRKSRFKRASNNAPLLSFGAKTETGVKKETIDEKVCPTLRKRFRI